MIRLIALDIDGTLVGEDSQVSWLDQAALSAARDKGCAIALISGRSKGTVLPIVEQFDKGVIAAIGSYDGALVEMLDPPEVVVIRRLEADAALRSFDALVDAGMGPEIFPGGEDDPVIEWDEAGPPEEWRLFNLWRLEAVDRAELERVLTSGPITISAMGSLEQATAGIDAVRAACGDSVSASLTFSPRYGGYFAQVASPESTKTHALDALVERLGIDDSQVLAVGDWLNDIGMLRKAGVGVAMGGCVDEVQEAADWVTGAIGTSAVARAVKRYVLDA
ncbi:MAG: HAD hydrolase family protein [Armatimonadia bacterium]|nr:HAD hydrolase family protein [Armatimonadia bacterium]